MKGIFSQIANFYLREYPQYVYHNLWPIVLGGATLGSCYAVVSRQTKPEEEKKSLFLTMVSGTIDGWSVILFLPLFFPAFCVEGACRGISWLNKRYYGTNTIKKEPVQKLKEVDDDQEQKELDQQIESADVNQNVNSDQKWIEEQ